MGCGCFPCFDSRKVEKLNPVKESDFPNKFVCSCTIDSVAVFIVRVKMSDLDVKNKFFKHAQTNLADANKPRMRRNLEPGVKSEVNAEDQAGVSISAQTFTFTELAVATKNFCPECCLGGGGFGRVYKGILDSTGQAVAVKQFDKNGLQGNREFLVEVLMLRVLHHPNLINLTGYCADGDQRLLVYEYMPLGSLEDHLHNLPPDKEPLSWNIRMKIAEGAAKGLEYLHNKANPPVIYRNFKSSNILLDEDFHPKLSDFGLAKLGPTGDQSHVSTRAMGTYGYCAPEYAMTGKLTVKSDVYSFGVVLLELITGRRAIVSTLPNGGQNLVAWARPLISDRREFIKLADPCLQGRFPMWGLYQALAIASMCIQENAAERPLARDIVTALSILENQAYDPNAPSGNGQKGSGSNKEGNSNVSEGAAKVSRSEEGEGSGRKWEQEGGPEMDESWKEGARSSNKEERERAVAEAGMWGGELAREEAAEQSDRSRSLSSGEDPPSQARPSIL